jgi:hypothetical protein
MPFRGRRILVAMVAAMAAAAPVCAQDLAPEQRLVQAFVKYCVETSADPDLRADIERGAPLKLAGETRFAGRRPFIDSAEILDSTARSDPYQRMLIYLGQGLGGSGRQRSCQVSLPWGSKPKLIAEVVRTLTMAEGTSSVINEGWTDLTRWTIQIGGKEAVIELGLPTNAGIPGRALTITLEE